MERHYYQFRRWETEVRFYETRVEADLFGELILYTIRGGKYNRHGWMLAVACGKEAIEKKIREIEKVRIRRGYTEVTR